MPDNPVTPSAGPWSPSPAELAAEIRNQASRRITGFQPLDGSGAEEVEAFECEVVRLLSALVRSVEERAFEEALLNAQGRTPRGLREWLRSRLASLKETRER